MKKITLLILCIATLGLVSCEKERFIQAPQNIVIVKDISPNAWTLSNDGFTYTVNLGISDIDQYHVDNEGTLVYISYNNGGSYTQLPFVYNVDTYSYEVYAGGLSIDIQRSDYQQSTPQKPNGTVRVKIILVATD
jgi:hypothetical protein